MHQIELSSAQRERFMHRIELADQEITAIQSLLKALTAQYTSVEDAHFIRDASLYAHELPRKVRAFLSDFKMLEPSSVCVIAGYPIDDTKIGKTPEHWQSGRAVSRTLEEELLFVLFGSLLGDIFGWLTQQGCYLVTPAKATIWSRGHRLLGVPAKGSVKALPETEAVALGL
jgi:hypothetical protein